MDSKLAQINRESLERFCGWLEGFGETSWDHQSFFGGPVGGFAKSLYYKNKLIGTAAVAPMIFFEAFLPSARRMFHHPVRFPIADAHYAMGFAFLHQATGEVAHLEKAVHFLEVLKKTRSSHSQEYCWGYPFDWVTRNGTLDEGTPFITSTPYMFEAFAQVNAIEPRNEWLEILRSIARHAAVEIKDFEVSATASSCSYSPYDKGGVINAAAYRSFLLTSAAQLFDEPKWAAQAERNLNFVLGTQNQDGSWYYAVDGVRDFVDHFHTCFVMKALAKIHTLTGHKACFSALEKGVDYYVKNLFDGAGLPEPFSKAPRMTVYKRELYDCAECINLCLLLRDRFPVLDKTLEVVVRDILTNWIQPQGCFRSRRLLLGWDNVPMHRWGQSQMFRSLAYLAAETASTSANKFSKKHVRDLRPA